MVWIPKLLAHGFERFGLKTCLTSRKTCVVIVKLASRQSKVTKMMGPSDASTKILTVLPLGIIRLSASYKNILKNNQVSIYREIVGCAEHNLGIRLSFEWLTVFLRVRKREKERLLLLSFDVL